MIVLKLSLPINTTVFQAYTFQYHEHIFQKIDVGRDLVNKSVTLSSIFEHHIVGFSFISIVIRSLNIIGFSFISIVIRRITKKNRRKTWIRLVI